MTEPITTGAALIGLGWAGKKVLGPSLEELGDQLKVYLSARMNKIFRKMDEIGAKDDAKALPSGFAYLALQKASFSDDDPKITEMWANLLLDASTDYTSRHSLFVNILSQLSAVDAKIADSFISESAINSIDPALDETGFDNYDPPSRQAMLSNLVGAEIRSEFVVNIESRLSGFEKDAANMESRGEGLQSAMTDVRDQFHAGVLLEYIFYRTAVHGDDDMPMHAFAADPYIAKHSTSFDVLVSLGLLNRSQVLHSTDFGQFSASFVSQTPIALAFARACRGATHHVNDESGPL